VSTQEKSRHFKTTDIDDTKQARDYDDVQRKSKAARGAFFKPKNNADIFSKRIFQNINENGPV
jgi:hypothetical protein